MSSLRAHAGAELRVTLRQGTCCGCFGGGSRASFGAARGASTAAGGASVSLAATSSPSSDAAVAAAASSVREDAIRGGWRYAVRGGARCATGVIAADAASVSPRKAPLVASSAPAPSAATATAVAATVGAATVAAVWGTAAEAAADRTPSLSVAVAVAATAPLPPDACGAAATPTPPRLDGSAAQVHAADWPRHATGTRTGGARLISRWAGLVWCGPGGSGCLRSFLWNSRKSREPLWSSSHSSKTRMIAGLSIAAHTLALMRP